MTTTTLDTLPNTCRCGARWAGTRTAHCAADCHQNFSNPKTFDQHRRSGRCTPPTAAGLTLDPRRPYPCWGTPMEQETP